MIREALTAAAVAIIGTAVALYLIALAIAGAITAAEMEDSQDDGHPWPK